MDTRSLKASIDILRQFDFEEINQCLARNNVLMQDPDYCEDGKEVLHFPAQFEDFLVTLRKDMAAVVGSEIDPAKAANNLIAAMPPVTIDDVDTAAKLERVLELTVQFIAYQNDLINKEKITAETKKYNDQDNDNIYHLQQTLTSKIMDIYYKDGHLAGVLNILKDAKNHSHSSSELDEIIKTVASWKNNFNDFTVDHILEAADRLNLLTKNLGPHQNNFIALAYNSLGGAGEFREKVILDLAKRSEDKKSILMQVLLAFKEDNVDYKDFRKEIDKIINIVADENIENIETLKTLIKHLTALDTYNLNTNETVFKGDKAFLYIARNLCRQLGLELLSQKVSEQLTEGKDIDILDYYKLKAEAGAMRVEEDFRTSLEAYRDKILRQKANEIGLKGVNDKGEDNIQKFITDKTKYFPELSKIMLMETLLKTFPLEKIDKQVEKLFPIEKTRDAFNQDFFDYKMRHAYEIWNWQMDLKVDGLQEKTIAYTTALSSSSTQSSSVKKEEYKSVSSPDANLIPKKLEARAKAIDDCKDRVNAETYNFTVNFIKNIKRFIETNTWKTGIKFKNFQFGGAKIKLTNGEKKTVPAKIAKIYKEIGKIDKDNDYFTHFNEIVKIGVEAGNAKPFKFFGINFNKEDPKTQQFFSLFKKVSAEHKKILALSKQSK